ncbi:MAG: hypothetical protein ABWX65_12920 [Mycetocola sp.]
MGHRLAALQPVMVSDGYVQVDSLGRVTVTVPADAPDGDHRLVVLDTDGDVISWSEVTIAAAQTIPDPIPTAQRALVAPAR